VIATSLGVDKKPRQGSASWLETPRLYRQPDDSSVRPWGSSGGRRRRRWIQVDALCTISGMAMGPLAMGDLAGSTSSCGSQEFSTWKSPGFRHTLVADELCEMVAMGRKRARAGTSTMKTAAVRRSVGRRDDFSGGYRAASDHEEEIIERTIYALVKRGSDSGRRIGCGRGHRHRLSHRLRSPRGAAGPMFYATR